MFLTNVSQKIAREFMTLTIEMKEKYREIFIF